MSNKVEATFHPLNDFPAEKSTPDDFPVTNEKPVEKRFSGLKTAGEAFGLMVVGLILLIVVGCGLAMLGVLVAGWVQAFIIYPVGTGLGTGIVIVIYILCYIAVKRGYKI